MRGTTTQTMSERESRIEIERDKVSETITEREKDALEMIFMVEK